MRTDVGTPPQTDRDEDRRRPGRGQTSTTLTHQLIRPASAEICKWALTHQGWTVRWSVVEVDSKRKSGKIDGVIVLVTSAFDPKPPFLKSTLSYQLAPGVLMQFVTDYAILGTA